MQPRNFPLFLMLLTAIINVLLIRQILKAPPRQLTAHSYHTWGTIALMVVFYLVTVFADMMLAISLVVFSLCILWGERRLWVAALLAVLTPGTIFLFFDLVLQIRFPKGILTNLYYG